MEIYKVEKLEDGITFDVKYKAIVNDIHGNPCEMQVGVNRQTLQEAKDEVDYIQARISDEPDKNTPEGQARIADHQKVLAIVEERKQAIIDFK